MFAIAQVTAPTIAQNTIFVDSGEVLTELDIVNGSFMGQLFELDPSTIFHINGGGVIGPVGSSAELSPFDFGGSTVNLQNGSSFSTTFEITPSYLSNIAMNASAGSSIWNVHLVGNSSHLNFHGSVYYGRLYDGASLNITNGILAAGTSAHRGSSITATGGILQSVDFYDASSLHAMNTEITNNFSLSSGSTATLINTTVGVEARVHSSTFVMDGGSIANDADFTLSQVQIRNATIGDAMIVRVGHMELIDNIIGDNFRIDALSDVVMRSGSIGNNARISRMFGVGYSAGTLTMYGGSVGERFIIEKRGTLNMYGGTISDALNAISGSEVNLFVSELYIDGVEIDLVLNEELVILQRDGALLEATLADGTFFDLTLNHSFVPGEDQLTNNVRLTATLVPVPHTIVIFGSFGLFSAFRRRS